MSKKSRSLVEAECNFIRKFMEQNLELGKSHRDIMNELQISEATYYRHVKRIMDEDSKIWEKQYLDSAKYRAVQLLTDLQNCRNLCIKIAMDDKEHSRDRIEAYKTAAEASANIFKLINEGPVFRLSIPQNKIQELTNDNDSTKQLPI